MYVSSVILTKKLFHLPEPLYCLATKIKYTAHYHWKLLSWSILLTKVSLFYEVWYNSIWPMSILILQCIFNVCTFIKHYVSLKLSTQFPRVAFIYWRPRCNFFSWNKSTSKQNKMDIKTAKLQEWTWMRVVVVNTSQIRKAYSRFWRWKANISKTHLR